MKLIAIQAENASQGEFVFGAIDDAVEYGRGKVEDLVLVMPGDGKLEIRHRKGWFGRMFGSGIDDGTAKRVHAKGPAGGAFVLALTEPSLADALARRARTVTGGDLKTYAVDGDELTELSGVDATYALDDTESALLEEPSVSGGGDDLPRGRLSRP